MRNNITSYTIVNDEGKHIKTIAYNKIYSFEVDYEAVNR